MSKSEYTPCGGCGATSPEQRCIGCLHNFGAGSWNPSAALSASLSDAERHERAVQVVLGTECERHGIPYFECIDPVDVEAIVSAYNAAIAAPPPPPPAAVQGPVAVKVAPLEWVEDWGGCEDDIPEWRAKTPFGPRCATVAGYRNTEGHRYERHADVPAYLKDELIGKSEKQYQTSIRSALSPSQSDPAPEIGNYIPCPCTTFEQGEDCPVGYPSLLCSACEGKGVSPIETVVALAAEMLKIAEQVDELEDPFATWESIELLKSPAPKIAALREENERLREALKPFSGEAERWEPRCGAYWPDEVPFPANSMSSLKIGHLRCARSALQHVAKGKRG